MQKCAVLLLAVAACSSSGKSSSKPGQGNPLPSGISAGQTCAPEQCPQPAPQPKLCADGSQPPPACVTNVADRCDWVDQCPK